MPGRNNNDVEGTNETFNFDLAAAVNVNEQLDDHVRGASTSRTEVNDQFVDTSDRVFVFHHTGREFLVGARYSLR